MSQQDIILIIIGSVVAMIAIGGGIIGTTYVLRPRWLLRQRMNQIGVIGDGAPSEKLESRRQRRIQQKIKQLEAKSEKRTIRETIDIAILQAGFQITTTTFIVICIATGLMLALLYVIAGMPPLGAIAVFLCGAMAVPMLGLKVIAAKRQKKFTEDFANAIDLVVRGVRSGLPVNECFKVCAREFPAPLGEEFRMLVEGQNLGMTVDDLMEKGIERIPTAEYKFFAIVIQIQRQTGGNLADTLAGLSNVLRERKKMRDKARAMASEATASAAIIGSLPFAVALLLSLVKPDYLMVLYYEKTGNYLVGFGLFWMFLGAMVMKKMINFKM